MGSLIKKPSELEVNSSIKVLVYGQPGLGKTTLGLSAPKPLLLDFDGGVHRVNALHQSDTVQVRKWEDVIEVLKEDLSDYQTLVIDTAGKMLDFMTVYIIQNDPKMGQRDGSLQLKGYGFRKVMFQNFLKQVSAMQKNLVFVAHDKEDKQGDNLFVRPDIGGSISGDLIKELDLVGYMEAIGKKRTISFDPCEKFYGKNTCGLDSLMDIPTTANKENNMFLSNIFGTYQQGLKDRMELVKDYQSLVDLITGNAESVTNIDELNEYLSWLSTIQHIWDSKIRGGVIANTIAKNIGVKFNKETKQYENV